MLVAITLLCIVALLLVLIDGINQANLTERQNRMENQAQTTQGKPYAQSTASEKTSTKSSASEMAPRLQRSEIEPQERQS